MKAPATAPEANLHNEGIIFAEVEPPARLPRRITVPATPKTRQKSDLQKVFILDSQGGYVGEFVMDQDCVIEFGDFLAAVPERGLADRQSIFIGEYNTATALHGEKVSLVLIAKGDVQPSEIAWGKAVLTTAEAHFGTPDAGSSAKGPDRAGPDALAKDIETRQAELAGREKAIVDTVEASAKEVEERLRAKDAEHHELRTRLADAEAQRDRLREEKALAEKEVEERLRAKDSEHQELRARLADAEAQRNRTREEAGRLPPPPAPGPDIAAERIRLEADRQDLERRMAELRDRESKLHEKEAAVGAQREAIEKAHRENQALIARIEAGKKGPPEFDVEAAKKDIEHRVKIIQKMAFDLLDREERLRKREEDLRKAESQ